MAESMQQIQVSKRPKCRAVVIWIDWYPYHVARFQGLQEAFGFDGEVAGIELVGGVGVHTGLKFREDLPAELPITTLLPGSSWSSASKVRLAYMLWRHLTTLDPDVVLVPGYYTLPAIAAALWARLHGRASVLMTESTPYDHPRTSWKEAFKATLIRLLFNWAVTGGIAHVRYLQQLGFPEGRIARYYDVVGNRAIEVAVESSRQNSRPSDHSLPNTYLLFIGRLAKEKNVLGLLQAWLTYRAQGGIQGLVLAGDGPEAASLRALVEASPFASHVLFAGHRTSSQLVPLLAFASSFVLPSTREPWGLVVNEAMAAGLPVLVSSHCGCSEDLVQHGVNGFVFNPLSQPDLVACLKRIDHLSVEDRAQMGERSAETISTYSPRNFGGQIQHIARSASSNKTVTALQQPEELA